MVLKPTPVKKSKPVGKCPGTAIVLYCEDGFVKQRYKPSIPCTYSLELKSVHLKLLAGQSLEFNCPACRKFPLKAKKVEPNAKRDVPGR